LIRAGKRDTPLNKSWAAFSFRVDPTKSCGSETCLKQTDGALVSLILRDKEIQTKGLTLTSKNQATTLKAQLRVNQ
jgi:hypothetical protein